MMNLGMACAKMFDELTRIKEPTPPPPEPQIEEPPPQPEVRVCLLQCEHGTEGGGGVYSLCILSNSIV